MRILLTGATGYVGGRLLKALEARGHELRCLARNPANLASRVGPGTRVVAGDVLDATSLAAALTGIETAYYLVHSLGDAGAFEEREKAGRGISLPPRAPPASGASSILVASEKRGPTSRRTCAAATRWVASSASRGPARSSYARPS